MSVQRVPWPTSCGISDPLYLPSINQKASWCSVRTGKRKKSNSVRSSPFPQTSDSHPYRDAEKVTDYGDENPLFMDFHNMDPEVYKTKFSSRGDATLSSRVVQLFKNVMLWLRLHNLFPGKNLTLLPFLGRYPCSFDDKG